jgi:hypothetical protein
MASGHVNRTKRPNTWLHRPASKREEKPCQLGAVHTWQIVLQKSAVIEARLLPRSLGTVLTIRSLRSGDAGSNGTDT